MSVQRHLVTMEPDELVEVYRHWAGEIGVPTANEELVKQELLRLMTDSDRVMQRFRELPQRCRDFLSWMVELEDYALPLSHIDERAFELPVKPFEVEAVAFALKKRGFITETRDRSWMRYDEPVYVIPMELGEVLASALRSGERSLESQLSLRAFLRTLGKDEIRRRLLALDCAPELLDDRSGLVRTLATKEIVQRALNALPAEYRHIVERVLGDHGGIGEVRHLERLGYTVEHPRKLKEWLERVLLGTIVTGDLTDVGLQLGQGSIVLFLDVVRGVVLPEVEVMPEDEPDPAADVLADIASIRTFLDHHSVRVTRDGSLYRATQRKMEQELLSPGARLGDREEALGFILLFLGDAGLVRPDDESRLRTTQSWKDFETRGPVDQTTLLLTYVQNNLRGVKGGFHQPRLRKIFLSVLREAGPGRWLSLKALSTLARNRYLMTLDRQVASERFQKKYKYVPIPQLPTPSMLARELQRFAAEALSWAGVVEVFVVEEQPVAVRLTRLGAAVLGFPVDTRAPTDEGGLIVTADFEVVLFPDSGGIELIHEVSRFARREKADYSLHYRIDERTIQGAVASGMSTEEIVGVLRVNGRYEVPQNVAASIAAWAEQVRVLTARRTLVISAPTKESLDAALRVREFKAIAGERFNDTTIELVEDPSTPRVSEALRTQGFFLR